MAEVLVDDSTYPLVRVTYPSEVSNADYERLFARYGELCKRPGRIAYRIDMTRFNPLTASATSRRHAASVFEQYRAELLRTTICEGRLFEGALVRGIVTAFDWLTGAKWPCQNFTSPRDLDAWLDAQRASDAKAARLRTRTRPRARHRRRYPRVLRCVR